MNVDSSDPKPHKVVYLATVDELIQLMRTCSLAKVRKRLEHIKKHHPHVFNTFVQFYQEAVK